MGEICLRVDNSLPLVHVRSSVNEISDDDIHRSLISFTLVRQFLIIFQHRKLDDFSSGLCCNQRIYIQS